MTDFNNKFSEAMRESEREIQKDTTELQREKDEKREIETDIPKLKQEIAALEKKREEDRHLLVLDEMNLPKINAKIRQTEAELLKMHQKIEQAQRTSAQNMKQAGVKGINIRYNRQYSLLSIAFFLCIALGYGQRFKLINL